MSKASCYLALFGLLGQQIVAALRPCIEKMTHNEGIESRDMVNAPARKAGGRFFIDPADHADFDHTIALPVQALTNQRRFHIFVQRDVSLGYYGLHSERQGLAE